MSQLNLINVQSATNSLDSKKADKAAVNNAFAGVEKASDASHDFGSLNSKVDTNSASQAKSFTAVNGRISTLSNSANTNYTSLSGVIDNLDVTNDKIQKLENLMHAGGETLPKLMAMATSYENEIGSLSADNTSLGVNKEDKAAANTALTSLQSSASNNAQALANSVADSVKANKGSNSTAMVSVNSKADSNTVQIKSLAADNSSLKDDVTQLISALSATNTTK